VEWSFDSAGGTVTVRQEGEQAVCRAIRAGGGGLYKAWLLGERGRALLGTLIPQGGGLCLRRVIPLRQLERQGAWPPVGAEVAAARASTGEAPPGWCWTDCPGRLLGEKALSAALAHRERGLLRREGEGFWLAFPYEGGKPFPLPALFCLSRVERLGDRWYVVFRFSRRGRPEVMHDLEKAGDTTGEV